MPTGTIVAYGGTAVPSGWLLCDGMAVSRAEYPSLFAAIGTTWGTPNPTTFAVPDLRGRFLRGVDSGAGRDPGRVLGTTQNDQIRAHRHHITGDLVNSVGTGSQFAANRGISDFVGRDTELFGGSETRPMNSAVTYIIKT